MAASKPAVETEEVVEAPAEDATQAAPGVETFSQEELTHRFSHRAPEGWSNPTFPTKQ